MFKNRDGMKKVQRKKVTNYGAIVTSREAVEAMKNVANNKRRGEKRKAGLKMKGNSRKMKTDQQKENISSDSEVSVVFDESDASDFIVDDESCSAEEDSPQWKMNDYVLVQFQGKKTTKHFVGVIIEETNDSEFSVSFLHYKNGKFITPEAEDISVVDGMDIIKKLPQPSLCGSTERAVGYLKFPINFEGYNMG